MAAQRCWLAPGSLCDADLSARDVRDRAAVTDELLRLQTGSEGKLGAVTTTLHGYDRHRSVGWAICRRGQLVIGGHDERVQERSSIRDPATDGGCGTSDEWRDHGWEHVVVPTRAQTARDRRRA